MKGSGLPSLSLNLSTSNPQVRASQMELYIATTNKHKVEEISHILAEYSIKVKQKELHIIEPDFDSLEEIAHEKAKQAFEKISRAVIAEDTGIYFEDYNNFPGVLAKRIFLGLGFDGLSLLIRNGKTRRASFKTT